MRPVIFRCPGWMFGLLLVGAIAPLAILPMVSALEWPPLTKLIIAAAEVVMLVYALTLVPTKLVLSDDGLWQKQLFSQLRLQWKDIAEWRYVKALEYEDFWIRDCAGKKHHLKRWLVFGKVRSGQVAEIMREKGVVGREDRGADSAANGSQPIRSERNRKSSAAGSRR